MTYEEFLEVLPEKIQELENSKDWTHDMLLDGTCASPDNEELAELIRSTNLKYTKKESDALVGDFLFVYCHGKKNASSTARFPLKELYKDCQGMGWEEVLRQINGNMEVVSMMLEQVMEHLSEFDVIQNRLIIRPINYPDNRMELIGKVYRRIGDIALVVYCETGEYLGNYMTVKIHEDLLSSWGKTKDEVFDWALANSNIKYPPRLYMDLKLDYDHIPYAEGAFMALNSTIKHIDSTEPMRIPALTCTKPTNGAVAMFYTGVKERLAELFGDDYYIVFTAVQEARLHRVGTTSPRERLRVLKEINQRFPTDMLSRKIYRYDGKKNEIIQMEL